MRQAVVALAFALLACKSRVEVRSDPVVADARPDTASVDAQPSRIVRGGEIIDLSAGAIAHRLGKPTSLPEASDRTHAYVFGAGRELHTHRLSDGVEVWKATLRLDPRTLHVGSTHVFVTHDDASIVAIRKSDGHLHEIKLARSIERAQPIGARVAVARTDHVVDLIDPVADATVASVTLPFSLVGREAFLQPLADGATLCAGVSDGSLRLQCFSVDGAARAKLDLSLAKGPPMPGHRIVAHDERYVLYGGVGGSAAVRLADAAILLRIADEAAAIVQREDGAFEGLLVVAPVLRFIDAAGTIRFSKPSSSHRDGASVVLRDGVLYVSTYPHFSTGSVLVAREIATGTELWKAEVEQLPIGHSEYFNEVTLSFFGDRLLVRGDESAVVTTQLFESKTGARVFAASHHR